MNSSITLNPSTGAGTSLEMRHLKKKSQSSLQEQFSPTPSLNLDPESHSVVYIAEHPVLFNGPQPRTVKPKLPWYAPQRLLLPFQFVAGMVILLLIIIITLKVFGAIGGTGSGTKTYQTVVSSKAIDSTTGIMYVDAVETSVTTVTITTNLPLWRPTAVTNLATMPTATMRLVERTVEDGVVGNFRRRNQSLLALVVGLGVWVLGEMI